MNAEASKQVKLAIAVHEAKNKRPELAIATTCIHGETSCIRCEQFSETPQVMWQSLEESDIKKVIVSLPDKVLTLMKSHPGEVVLAGGYIRATVGCEIPRDIDIYISNKTNASKWTKEAKLKFEEDTDSLLVAAGDDSEYDIQVCHKYAFTDPGEIPDYFDYTIIKVGIWYDKAAKTYVGRCHERFYRDLSRKILVYHCERTREDIFSIPRLMKYASYGYTIDPKSLSEVVASTLFNLDLTEGLEGAFKQLETAYTSNFDPKWEGAIKPYVKPKVKRRRTYGSCYSGS